MENSLFYTQTLEIAYYGFAIILTFSKGTRLQT